MTSYSFIGGESKSVAILYECLEVFAASSGLSANASKSAIYLAGIPDPVKDQIAQLSHMPLGSLPFRYLGIPLTSRRISAADCDSLVDKMTVKIHS